MANQQYATLPKNVLANAYTPGDTTITLVNADAAPFPFPTIGEFRIALEDPPVFFLRVTSRSGNVLTVDAAATDGTTAVNEPINTPVTQVLTADAFDLVRQNMLGYGTYASIPASGFKKGDDFLTTDGYYQWRVGGSPAAFVPFHGGVPMTPPSVSLAGAAWVNQNGATEVNQGGALVWTAPAHAADDNHQRVISAPGTPYEYHAKFLFGADARDFVTCALCWRESGSGKLVQFKVGYDSGHGGLVYEAVKYDSPTSFNSLYQTGLWIPDHEVWLGIADDGANRKCLISADGRYWETWHTVGRTNFLTADQIGVSFQAGNTAIPIDIVGLHFAKV